MKPEVTANSPIYEGKIFDVSRATINEDGVIYEREIVSHNGSAVIVPVFEDKTVALVRQYRHAAEKYLLELPAGSLETGEDPAACASRELIEEIGVKAETIELISQFWVSPGFLTEKMYVFLATNLTEVGQKLEDDELITVSRHTFPDTFEMIKAGEFEDAKTMVGIIIAGAKLGFTFS
jgi:ADP-ribose pyrophosphatase